MKIPGISGIAFGAACVLLGTSSTCTFAQDAAKTEPAPMIHSMDSTGDGKISHAEVHAGAMKLWEKADANKDGKLTLQEDQINSKNRFDKVDMNDDDQIIEEEFVVFWVGSDDHGRQAAKDAKSMPDDKAASPTGSILDNANKDADGQVSHVEAAKFRQSKFKQFDTDSNGKLNQDEYVQGRGQAFKSMDANSDGIVEKDEYIIFWIGDKKGSALKPLTEPAKEK